MLKSPAFAECQAQKRRPWTSFFVQLGPGDLNLVGKILIYKNSYRLIFLLEYHLEYGTPRDHPFCSRSDSTLYNHDWQ